VQAARLGGESGVLERLPEQQVFPYLWDGNYACRKKQL
jgi:hypothetical protein